MIKAIIYLLDINVEYIHLLTNNSVKISYTKDGFTFVIVYAYLSFIFSPQKYNNKNILVHSNNQSVNVETTKPSEKSN